MVSLWFLDQFAPNIAATNKALAFGDFKSYYTLRNVGQFEIARDPYTYLVSRDAVAFIGYGRGRSFITDAGASCENSDAARLRLRPKEHE